jgi:hypothetical protein
MIDFLYIAIASLLAGFFFFVGVHLAIRILMRFEPWLTQLRPTRYTTGVDLLDAVSVQRFELRKPKVFVQIENRNEVDCIDPQFRIIARDSAGTIIEESHLVAFCRLPPKKTTDVLLKFYDETEQESLFSAENEIELELLRVTCLNEA